MKATNKVPIDTNVFVYPMPMALVGALVQGQPNFMPVAWVSRVNYKPALIAVALGNGHHTNKGINATGFFSVNIPSEDLVSKVDYCGLVSGNKVNKANVFEIFSGMHQVPMIRECAITLECRVRHTIVMEYDTLYVGEILEAYSEERYLTDGKPDIEKIRPFFLSMPDNRYWTLGNNIAKAWASGKKHIR